MIPKLIPIRCPVCNAKLTNSNGINAREKALYMHCPETTYAYGTHFRFETIEDHIRYLFILLDEKILRIEPTYLEISTLCQNHYSEEISILKTNQIRLPNNISELDSYRKLIRLLIAFS